MKRTAAILALLTSDSRAIIPGPGLKIERDNENRVERGLRIGAGIGERWVPSPGAGSTALPLGPTRQLCWCAARHVVPSVSKQQRGVALAFQFK